jgi:hypothetical protein
MGGATVFLLCSGLIAFCFCFCFFLFCFFVRAPADSVCAGEGGVGCVRDVGSRLPVEVWLQVAAEP